MSSFSQKTHPKTSDRKFLFSVLFSLFVHLAVLCYQIANTNSPFTPEAPIASNERFIELSDLPPKYAVPQENQIVETEDAGNREIDPKASLLSDRNQKAQQQSRALRTDSFQKGPGTGENTKESDQEETQGNTSEDEVSLDLGASPEQKKKKWNKLSLKDLSLGGDGNQASASDDYLPNVASGERTILSTREFRYFSYYNRIKDLLRQYWKPSIEREVSKLWNKGQMLKENELVTRVLVLLDKTGQVQKISKIGASGVTEIDEIAVQAFYQASPFPNPPMGLVEADGFVRINWDFILQTAAAPQIQFRPLPNSARLR